MKKQDLTNKKFAKLTALSENGRARNGDVLWLCKCDCGNFTTTRYYNLVAGLTKSCGCLRKENSSKTIKKKNKKFRDSNYVEGTSLFQISKSTYKNNTSGRKGVLWDKRAKKWRAYICFRGERKKLGYFSSIEEAIKAREKAEEEYFEPILKKYKKLD